MKKKLNGLIQRELRKLYLRFSYVCINIMPHYYICMYGTKKNVVNHNV